MIAFREEELSLGNLDINSFLFWVVRDIVNEFKYIETNIYNVLEIDINYMIDDLNNYYTRYRSAIFFGDNCNKKVNEVVEKIEGQSIYEVEMKEGKDKENLRLLKDLINEDWHYYAQNDIVIIKNADVAFYDDLDTRTALLTFFSEIYEKGHVTLLLTSEDLNYLDDVKSLAGVRFTVGGDRCFKISQ